MRHTLGTYISLLRDHQLLSSRFSSDHLPSALIHTPIECITYDSRSVKPASLFIVKGAHFDPSFLSQAVHSGALAYVAEEAIAADLSEVTPAPAIIVKDIHQAITLLGALFVDHVMDNFRITGITGTKGKSTVAYFMRYILHAWLHSLGKPDPALTSSIKNYDGVNEEEAHLTTPEPLELYAHFSRAYQAGIREAVMEVSSQALKYGRVAGLRFAAAAFTNISSDHISAQEHPSFEDYYHSKLRIFDQADAAAVNLDADLAEQTLRYARAHTRVYSYGFTENADVYSLPESVITTRHGLEFDVHCPWYGDSSGTSHFAIGMQGSFNISNALCAITLSGILGIPEQHVHEGLQQARVPGRMEVFTSRDRNVIAIADYAHNKLSYDSVLRSAANNYPGYDILAIFGSAGGKAYNRRKELPEACNPYCTHVWITEEDNYSEPFSSIAHDIAQHLTLPYTIEENREECIRQAIMEWPDRRVVLILGKGAETTRARGHTYVEFPPDTEYAAQYIAQYDATHPCS